MARTKFSRTRLTGVKRMFASAHIRRRTIRKKKRGHNWTHRKTHKRSIFIWVFDA
jgi:hypothetical protein